MADIGAADQQRIDVEPLEFAPQLTAGARTVLCGMLEASIAVVRSIHIVAGVIALCTFAVPLLVPKGNRTHRRAGWVYVIR